MVQISNVLSATACVLLFVIFGAAQNPGTFGTTPTAQRFTTINNAVMCDAQAGADAGAKLNACLAALPVSGGVADARGITGTQAAAATIVIPNKTTLLLAPGLTLTGGAAASPVMSFGQAVNIVGGAAISTTVKTATAANSVLAPTTPAGLTRTLTVYGVTFFNSNVATTAPVVDLTNTGSSIISTSFILDSGGTASVLLVSGPNAYYDHIEDTYISGAGAGTAVDIRTNDFTATRIVTALTTKAVNIQGTSGAISNGVSFYDSSLDSFSVAFNIPQYAKNIRVYGGRIESQVRGATLFNIGATGTGGVYMYSPLLSSLSALGTDRGVVSWYGMNPTGVKALELDVVNNSSFRGNVTATKVNGSGPPVASSTAATSRNPTIDVDQQLIELSFSAGYFNTLHQPFQIQGGGIYSRTAASSPALTFKIKLCTVSGCGSGTVVTLVNIVTSALNTAALANATWALSVAAVTNAAGATGNLVVKGTPGLALDIGALLSTPVSVFADTNIATSANIDLTGALFIDFTVAQSVAGASNSYTQMMGLVR